MSVQITTRAPTLAPAQQPGFRVGQKGRRAHFFAYLYVFPAILVLGAFHFFPTFYAFIISLHNWGLIDRGYVGFKNYLTAFDSSDFWNSLLVTGYYAVGPVPPKLLISLIIAYLLFQMLRGLGFYRYAFFLPDF